MRILEQLYRGEINFDNAIDKLCENTEQQVYERILKEIEQKDGVNKKATRRIKDSTSAT